MTDEREGKAVDVDAADVPAVSDGGEASAQGTEPMPEAAKAKVEPEAAKAKVEPDAATAALDASLTTMAEGLEDSEVHDRKRAAEIIAVLAAHNFYANGFTPWEMRTTLEDLGPTYVKIGQILSSRNDMLPDAYCEELAKLRSNVAPLPAETARAVIEAEVGRPIDEIYAEFDDDPLGSASIAQAHYGVLKDGTRVVTKVQRPLIADMMRRDFVLLHKIAHFMGVVRGGGSSGVLDLDSALTELENVTEEELDFRVEAQHTRVFREKCIEDPSVISCPEIIDELTTERILTMTFVEGYSLAHGERIDEDGYDRHALAETIFMNYLHQVLDVGTFHADPHQGNIMLSHGVPYWIDFGMVGHVDARSISVLQTVILSMISGDTEALADAALALGKTNGKVDKAKFVEDVDDFVGRYVSVGSVSDLDVGSFLGELTDLMDRHGISMPGEYTMLVRGLVTIEGVVEELCPALDVFGLLAKRMMQRAKADFDLMSTLMGEVQELASTGMRAAKIPALTYDVLRNLAKGRMKVNVELTGYEDLSVRLTLVAQSAYMAAFSCVLFLGACLLAALDIEPMVNNISLSAILCFVLSAALAIHAVRRMNRMR